MFTGLIEEIGSIKSLSGKALTISCTEIQTDLSLGDSVSVNGVCLTIVRWTKGEIEAEVMPVTLQTTNLGALKPKDTVNLERALRMGDRIGGHLVSGHIDGTAKIVMKKKESDALLVTIEIPKSMKSYVIKKGSIAIDGISLTIAFLDDDKVTVSLVGHTKEHTSLASKNIGQLVNVEYDQIGKYVHRMVDISEKPQEKMSLSFLNEHGFAL